MLVAGYLDPRRASSTSKSAECGNYEAFVVVHCCQFQLIQPQILTNKQYGVTITTRRTPVTGLQWLNVFSNFIMMLDALTNTFLGSHKSKDKDKAEPIPKKYIFFVCYKITFLEWGNNSLEEAWYWLFFTTFKFCPITSHFAERGSSKNYQNLICTFFSQKS